MSRVRIALAAGLALIVVAIGFTLSEAPPSVARKSATAEETLGFTNESHTLCQAGELLPRGTSAIRLSLGSFVGPRISLRAYVGKRLLTGGGHAEHPSLER